MCAGSGGEARKVKLQMDQLRAFVRACWHAKLLSPPGLLVRAGLIVAVFATLHLLGWRDDTRIISGTSLASSATVFRGFVYAAAYFAAIILGPILILAAAIQGAIQASRLRRHQG